jgi:hypothetical protein
MIARASILLLLLCAGCATGPVLHGDPMVETRLYFGLRIEGGGEVSDAQWREFLDSEITPRFPDGLTVLQAYGQWRDGLDGPIGREPSRVLVIVHGGDADARIAALVAAYKARFKQQAVLRVDTAAGVDFFYSK